MEKLSLFEAGGYVMYPLFFAFAAALYAFFERAVFYAVYFYKKKRGVLKFLKINKDYYLSLPLEKRDFYLLKKLKKLSAGLNIFDTVITLSPLLGILGTVIGIIKSFNILSFQGVQSPAGVIKGIAEALITTAAGLSIAVTAIVLYRISAYLRDRETERIEGELNDINAR